VKRGLALLVACLCCGGTAGCKKNSAEAPPVPVERVPEPARPIDAAVVIDAPPPDAGMPAHTGEVTVDELVREARLWVAPAFPDLALVTIGAHYLRPDGKLDPRYGSLALEFHTPLHPVSPIDDPDRPTGAPIAVPEPTDKPRERGCPRPVWSKGAWAYQDGFCSKRLAITGPRCTVAKIWERAIAKGAPANALAIIRLGYPNANAGWRFSIKDPLRKVDLDLWIPDDCPLQVEQ